MQSTSQCTQFLFLFVLHFCTLQVLICTLQVLKNELKPHTCTIYTIWTLFRIGISNNGNMVVQQAASPAHSSRVASGCFWFWDAVCVEFHMFSVRLSRFFSGLTGFLPPPKTFTSLCMLPTGPWNPWKLVNWRQNQGLESFWKWVKIDASVSNRHSHVCMSDWSRLIRLNSIKKANMRDHKLWANRQQCLENVNFGIGDLPNKFTMLCCTFEFEGTGLGKFLKGLWIWCLRRCGKPVKSKDS